MNAARKLRLSDGPDKTATWIWLDPVKGRLKVEYYDFSEKAQRLFGNDIAYTIMVEDMGRLLSTVNLEEAALLPWMAGYFKSYFGIKQWLEESKIGFRVEIEGWA
jgi:hypothetical protein